MGSAALDLDDIDPRVWRVKSDETVYGPYTLGQMYQYVREGRIAAHTLIADGVTAFGPAGEAAPLRGAFAKPASEADPSADEPKDGEAAQEAALSNVLVIIKSDENTRAMLQALAAFGAFLEVTPGTVVLKTGHKLARIHAGLSAAAGPGDIAIFVNTSSGRIAWMGLEASLGDALRAVWGKPDVAGGDGASA